jgi:hypothetical protein
VAERSINITISARNLTKEVWDQLAAAAEKTQSKFEGAGKAGGVFTSILESGFARLTAALSVANLVNKAVDAVLNFAHAGWGAGDMLVSMAAKTDLSIGFLQKLQFVAATSSTSLESLTNLAYVLGVNLAGGDASVVAAVNKVGLSFEALLRMSPDEQFEAVVVALEHMTNAGERNRAGNALMGRAYRENAAALAHWTEKSQGFVGASDDEVQALAKQKEAWEGLKQRITDTMTARLGQMALGLEQGKKEIDVYKSMTAEQRAYYQELSRAGLGQQYLAKLAEERAAKEHAASVSQRQDVALLSPAQEAAAIITAALAEAHVKLSPAIRGAAEQLLRMGLSADEVFAKLKAGGLVTELQHKAITVLGEAHKSTGEAAKKHAEAVTAYTEKVTPSNAESRVAAEVLRKVGDAGIHLSLGLEKLPGRLIAVSLVLNDIEEHAASSLIPLQDFGFLVGRQIPIAVEDGVFSLNAWVDTLRKLPKEAKPAGSAVRESFDKIAESLVQLAQVSGDSFSSVLQDIASFLVAMKMTDEAGKGLNKSSGEIGAAFKTGDLKGGVAGFANLASSALQAGAAMAQATSSGSQGMRALKGAATGAQIGMAFGPIGAAVGAAVGAIVGAIRGRQKEFQKIASDIGRDMGVNISEGLAKAIEVDSKRLGDRVAASLLHINDIIKEAGGVEAFGVDKAIAKTRDLFVQIATGKLSVTEAGKAFDEAFGAIIPAAIDKTTGLISKQALELIQLDEKFGTHAASVAQFVGAQHTSIIGGLKAFTDNAVVTSEGAASGLAAAVAAAFAQAQAQGLSTIEALKEIDPVVATLEAQFKAAGLSGGDAFGSIASLAAVARDEIVAKGITAVEGLRQVLVGTYNTGILNQEMFAGLATQISDTYTSLVAQGKDGNAILRLMQPELQTIWELQQKTGYTVDETTQALIDQGIAAGIVGSAHKSAADRGADAMERVADTLDRIADKMGVAGDAAGTMASKVTKAIDQVPTDIDIRFHANWTPPGSPPEPESEPTHQAGAVITRTHRARVHAGEIIGPVSFMREALAGALAELRGSMGTGSAGDRPIEITVISQLEGQQVARTAVRFLPDELRRLGLA